MISRTLILLCIFTSIVKCTKEIKQQYQATWKSLDSRPNPQWFDDSKIGLLMHWGVYSVPAFGSEWTSYRLNYNRYSVKGLKQFLDRTFKVNVSYPELAPSFTAALFNANSWAKLFKKSGVKYVVLTGKHVDGYTLWPSKTSFNWNSMQVGPKRDLLGELGKAVKNVGLRYGVYYSLYEIFNPLIRLDYKNGLLTQYYTQTKIRTELNELVNQYKPDIIWSMDGPHNEEYLKTKEFLAWLFNESPVKDSVVVNDRWGRGTMCRHGGFSMFHGCRSPNSKVMMKYEAAVNIDRSSWGYNRLAHSYDYLTIQQILTILTRVVSGGGNMILNIGPTHDGRIPPIVEERLLQLGEWLDINGVAIYKTQPWIIQKDKKNANVFYTKSKETVFAIVLKSPIDGILRLGSLKGISNKSKINLLTTSGDLALGWHRNSEQLEVKLVASSQIKWFPVLKFTGLNEKNNESDSNTPLQSTENDNSSKPKQASEISVEFNEIIL